MDCNLILANGAFKSNTPPDNDENAAVRAQLKGKITLIDRIVPLGHFGHNKFVVFCDSQGAPQQVLTGSTNWTTSGLCTQANNGLIIDDPGVAAYYEHRVAALAPILARSPAFDPHAPIFAAIAQDPLLQDRILIAEPWDVGPGGYQLGRFRQKACRPDRGSAGRIRRRCPGPAGLRPGAARSATG